MKRYILLIGLWGVVYIQASNRGRPITTSPIAAAYHQREDRPLTCGEIVQATIATCCFPCLLLCSNFIIHKELISKIKTD